LIYMCGSIKAEPAEALAMAILKAFGLAAATP
jgi:hypothetical protein